MGGSRGEEWRRGRRGREVGVEVEEGVMLLISSWAGVSCVCLCLSSFGIIKYTSHIVLIHPE